MRKLIDGDSVPELDEAMLLTVRTKCPEKWLLIDRETGEVYTPYTTEGPNQWKKITSMNWLPPRN
jgi:hypothetical protein